MSPSTIRRKRRRLFYLPRPGYGWPVQRFIAPFILCGLIASAAAAAQPATLLAGKAWSAYAEGDKNAKTCYLAGKPAKNARAGAGLMVSHRLAEKAFNVVTFNLGYAAKDGANAELAIDGKKFQLFIEKNAAWSPDAPTDAAITKALEHGKTATLKASPVRGAATTDTYALAGLAPALAAIDKACGVKR